MDLDELALSGALFTTGPSSAPRTRSPPHSRSPSPDAPSLWPSNDTSSDLSLSPSGSTSNLNLARDVPAETTPQQSARTGVKGVLRDRNEAVSRERAQRALDVKAANRRMEKMALTGRTYREDEEARAREEGGARGRGELERDRDRGGRRMFERTGRFGHLREVGEAGFLDAVEGEMGGTWVLIHIYDPSLSRCHDFDAILARLARQHPQTKFLRARAGALDFASSSSARPSTSESDSNLITISEKASYSDDEEDDPYLYDEEEEVAQDATDTDMLPTLLAYRSGELVHSWVRVDWEAEAWMKRGDKNTGTNQVGVESLLQGHYIIQPSTNGNCGFSSDEAEDELELEFTQGGGGAEHDDELFDL